MTETYKTIAGDTWDMVALHLLGGEEYTSLLLEANPKHIQTVIFDAGIILTIPKITVPEAQNLPPWKR
ncbi:MAG: tail protein X [Acidaminococcaceae bacterium]